MLRAYFPDLKLVEINAARNMHLTQIVGKSASKGKMAGDDETMRRETEEIVAWIATKHAKVLLVTFKDAKLDFNVPANVAVEHYFNLRGVDIYKDYDAIILLGSPLPPVWAAERHALALTYKAAVDIATPGNYRRVVKAFHTAEGVGARAVDTWEHEDPIAEQFRWQASVGEALQCADRLRLVHRKDKASVYAVGHMVLPFPVDEFIEYKTAVPSRIEKRKGRGAMGPEQRARHVYDDLGGVLPLSRRAWIYSKVPASVQQPVRGEASLRQGSAGARLGGGVAGSSEA